MPATRSIASCRPGSGHTGDVAEREGEHLPTVEILDGTDAEVTSGPRRSTDTHAWVRTVAAVVAAAGILWGASALHASRTADEKLACMTELQMSTFLPGFGNATNLDTDDVRERIAAAAVDCDLTHLRAAFDDAETDN